MSIEDRRVAVCNLYYSMAILHMVVEIMKTIQTLIFTHQLLLVFVFPKTIFHPVWSREAKTLDTPIVILSKLKRFKSCKAGSMIVIIIHSINLITTTKNTPLGICLNICKLNKIVLYSLWVKDGITREIRGRYSGTDYWGR